jgi:hypothetical protein
MVPFTVAVLKQGYPVAVIVPVIVALLAPKLALSVIVPVTAIGAGGLMPVNVDIYAEFESVPVKLPFSDGTRKALHVPVVCVVKHAPP